ncbi:MAG: hypothetical protein ACD_65C00366G0002 [uncultured bacterium]|nr:MAG: hypothetical protein ACD_65C00366G0002 [uncultured bacterium]KKT02015.1 MAG: hypothetical protein UV80_C0006G0005 [Candidatus Peregrinibacteria bacterium GW2011_GWF2_43_17]KKT18714.1 MAG: hypothetical protein UW03_C0033G0011 [Candidatus Peregrinibacteria bacterium GW2011_GWA2_43_8]HAU40403.1 hypothetical protein [Candidatus Peregrinibacteria bacterium]
MTNSFTIDRKEASELVGISLRTLDRYIRSGRLQARKIDGFVKLDENEVKAFRTGYVPNEADTGTSRRHRSLNDFENMPILDVQSELGKVLGEDFSQKESAKGNVYEILYKETRDDLKEHQQKLELANYRLGQLEAQVTNSIPLLEHKAQSKKYEIREGKLKEIARKYIKEAKAVKVELGIEKLNAKVYVVLLFIVLGLQPILWWILQK